jgi:hypothetical protein
MSIKRQRSPSAAPPLDIYRSESIEDQKSIFTAAFSNTLSVKALQCLPEFVTADHKIAAWRKRSRQKSLMPESKILYDLGHDDDGEKWAGGRLQNVLNDTQVEGVVVVARWYGGQNIGPIRFTHIENTAKEAIWKWRTADTSFKTDQAAKKQKLEEESAREELASTLPERDTNITVLRGLLAEKNAKLKDDEPAPPTPQKPPPDYSKMSLDALKRVDKARDATIAFILKQIDKVDEELKLLEVIDDATQDSWNDVEEQHSTTEGDGHGEKKDES